MVGVTVFRGGVGVLGALEALGVLGVIGRIENLGSLGNDTLLKLTKLLKFHILTIPNHHPKSAYREGGILQHHPP